MGTTEAPGKLDPIRNLRTRQRTGASLQDRKSRNSWPDLVVVARRGDRATRTRNPTREKAVLGTTPFQHVLRGAQPRPHRAHRELCAGTLTRSCPHPFLLPLRSQGEKKKRDENTTDKRWIFISPSVSDVPRPPQLHKPNILPAPWDLLTEPDGDDRSENERKQGTP